MAAARKFFVTATPPTTNGDLHVGHLAGPYLNADVFCRAQRQRGNETLYISSGDDNQSYVVTAARSLNTTPEALAAECNKRIRQTLTLADIQMDAFTAPDEEHEGSVRDFFRVLHLQGRLRERTYDFPYSRKTGRCLVEAFASGYCPECLACTSGAICEGCGHPNDVSSLLYPQATGSSDFALEEARKTILVLPLEGYRTQITEFYARRRRTMRPHVLRFIEEMLATPLPDFPITYPDSWGIDPLIEGLDDQVINVWAEMLPGLYRTANYALRGVARGTRQDVHLSDSGYELIQFLGYDNTFYFSLVHLCLALAKGDVVIPTAIITNEFYHLDGSKFSTSRRHLIWARDLVDRYGSDNVRFYLALDNPENQTANFTEQAFLAGVRRRLHAPLRVIAQAIEPLAGRSLASGGADTQLVKVFRTRMQRAYDLETFSIRQAAETVVALLELLADRAARISAGDVDELEVVVYGLGRLARDIWPLAPKLGSQLAAALQLSDPAAPVWPEEASVVVPELTPARLFKTV